ncbi:UvrD-helicase domain-containing protein [Solwaraspora sp. WMMD937]|uniref:UvrD-helicase domain-containing protein n=1 Tax=Solwaraspora sp. WMMD937 TaxID=3016090 RepID=UPI00249B451B|nr:UvrD-helicase domain-containing protein [Solwaraspora sp. WMMD937]WFE24162.1 UvrD-helicase domain-containing protein [Solwaraspora sp. WMMD937]
MEALRAELAAAGATTHLQLCADAARLLADGDTGAAEDASLRFDHVVVDEAQDLHPAQWRVLRAAVPAGPDDTSLTGDPHQRVYDAKVSLAALGIRTAGRSFRLRINYRSTAEILTWSTGLLDGDGRDDPTGYRSLLRGRRPTLAGFRTSRPRRRRWCSGPASGSTRACGRQRSPSAPGSRPGWTRCRRRWPRPASRRCWSRTSRQRTSAGYGWPPCVLFVACTRAREALHVSWTGQPSQFLPR